MIPQTHNYCRDRAQEIQKGTVPLPHSRQGEIFSGLQNVENGICLLTIRMLSFYKALRGIYLIAILNKTSGCVPLCLKIRPSTCLFKSLLPKKAWLQFWCPFGQKFSSKSLKRNGIWCISVDLLLLIISGHFLSIVCFV